MREIDAAIDLVDVEDVAREVLGQCGDHLLAAVAQRDQVLPLGRYGQVLVGHGVSLRAVP